jgi:hypothetical protein
MGNDEEYWADQIKDIAECCLLQLQKLEKLLTPEQCAEIDGMKDDLELIITIIDEVLNESS